MSNLSGAFAPPSERTIYVSNLHENITEELLMELFIQMGSVIGVSLKKAKKESGASSFAFVEFQDEESVLFAVEMMDGVELFGKSLRVTPRSNSSKAELYKFLREKFYESRVRRTFSTPTSSTTCSAVREPYERGHNGHGAPPSLMSLSASSGTMRTQSCQTQAAPTSSSRQDATRNLRDSRDRERSSSSSYRSGSSWDEKDRHSYRKRERESLMSSRDQRDYHQRFQQQQFQQKRGDERHYGEPIRALQPLPRPTLVHSLPHVAMDEWGNRHVVLKPSLTPPPPPPSFRTPPPSPVFMTPPPPVPPQFVVPQFLTASMPSMKMKPRSESWRR